MSERSPVSADPSAHSEKRKRERRRARIALGVAIAMWPAILQIERLGHRAESLKVIGQTEVADGRGHGGGARQLLLPGYRRSGVTAPAPNYGALREGLPDVLAAHLPAAVTLADARESDFLQPLDFALADPSQGGPDLPFSGLPTPGTPDTGVIFGPSGPGGGTPGNPPVVDPGGTNPPVTNPPVVDPGQPQPPVVTPPLPPPVTDPNPPVTDPGTLGPPGDSGGTPPGTPPGDPPIPSGVPEPAVWLQLVLGAGLAGASLRHARRRQPVAIALRARSRRSPTT